MLFFLLDDKFPQLPLNSVVMEDAYETEPEFSAICETFGIYFSLTEISGTSI